MIYIYMMGIGLAVVCLALIWGQPKPGKKSNFTKKCKLAYDPPVDVAPTLPSGHVGFKKMNWWAGECVPLDEHGDFEELVERAKGKPAVDEFEVLEGDERLWKR